VTVTRQNPLLTPRRKPAGRAVGTDQTASAGRATEAQRRPAARPRQGMPHGYPVCAAHGHPVGVPAAGDGLWKWGNLLEAPQRLAQGGDLGEEPQGAAGQARRRGQDRLPAGADGFLFGGGRFWGGRKRVPIPPTGPKRALRGTFWPAGAWWRLPSSSRGPTRTTPNRRSPWWTRSARSGACGEGHEKDRRRSPPIRPTTRPRSEWAFAGAASGSSSPCATRRGNRGIGKIRWVVERTVAWLNQLGRLRIRYERRPEIHEALLLLGCALICWNFLQPGFCESLLHRVGTRYLPSRCHASSGGTAARDILWTASYAASQSLSISSSCLSRGTNCA